MTTVVKSGKGIYAPSAMRGATLYAKLIGALSCGDPMSYDDIAYYTGLCVHTVRRYIMALREHKPRLARIAEWQEDRTNNPSIRCFELGSANDAKRPKRTKAEKYARHRKNKRILHRDRKIIQATAGGNK